MIHTYEGVGIPVGGGLDVNNRECDGVPLALGDTRIADSLHSCLVRDRIQPADGNRVGRGRHLLPLRVGSLLVLDVEIRVGALPCQRGRALG